MEQKRGEIDLEQLQVVMRSLSDDIRLSLLFTLASGERHVKSLCEELNSLQPTISHHLNLLKISGLINSKRAGKMVIYRLSETNCTAKDGGLNIQAGSFQLKVSPRVLET